MKTSVAISHSAIVAALPLDYKAKSEIEDALVEWFDAGEFYFVDINDTDSGNFSYLPEEVKTFLRVERPAEHFMIYLDR